MKIKTMVNSEGEQQVSRIDLKLEVGYGDKGKQAVQNLIGIIERLSGCRQPEDVIMQWGVICGYALCCETFGILTEKSADELVEVAEKLADFNYERAKKEAEKGNNNN